MSRLSNNRLKVIVKRVVEKFTFGLRYDMRRTEEDFAQIFIPRECTHHKMLLILLCDVKRYSFMSFPCNNACVFIQLTILYGNRTELCQRKP